jgi:hypothetical protein
MIPTSQSSDLRPEGPSARMRAAASAAKPRAADAARVTPQACLWHDAFEGHDGETVVRLV